MKALRGGSYFGSGNYTAEWITREGTVEAIPTGWSDDNGFREVVEYDLKAKGGTTALVEIVCRDWRGTLGEEGMWLLRDDGSWESWEEGT